MNRNTEIEKSVIKFLKSVLFLESEAIVLELVIIPEFNTGGRNLNNIRCGLMTDTERKTQNIPESERKQKEKKNNHQL